jgi:hypothetical protein
VVESLGGIQGQARVDESLFLSFVVNASAQNINVNIRHADTPVGAGFDIEWRAEPWDDYPETEGLTQVDSYTIDGTRAYGTATFLDQKAFVQDLQTLDSTTGTFDFDCGS